MKRTIFTIFAALEATLGITAQEVMIVDKTDGTNITISVSKVSKVHFEQLESTNEAVDLGLPSGIKWASCNLDALNPEDFGGYYAWGEIEAKTEFFWSNYLTSEGGCITDSNDNAASHDPLSDYLWGGTNYKVAAKAGVADGIGGTQYDAAHVQLGGNWRLPTKAEIEELKRNCTWKFTTLNGVNGYKVTGSNGNYIFLPFAGFRDEGNWVTDSGRFQCSTPCDDWMPSSSGNGSYFLNINADAQPGIAWWYRYLGYSIRPVSE